MYKVSIDATLQVFFITDKDGYVIASRQMPYQQTPNPGKTVLMANEANWEAWKRIRDLVRDANN